MLIGEIVSANTCIFYYITLVDKSLQVYYSYYLLYSSSKVRQLLIFTHLHKNKSKFKYIL